MIFKDTHREKALSNKTPTLTKSRNMDIWVIGKKNKVVTGKSQFFVKGLFCTPHSICLNIGF